MSTPDQPEPYAVNNSGPLGLVDSAICCILFALLCARDTLAQHFHLHRIDFQDDAYYYFVLARHLVQEGKSTFDGHTLTNGYHPLWMLVVAFQYKVFSQSPLLTRVIEILLGLGTLITTLLVVRLPNLLLNLLFTIGLFKVLTLFAFNGMETTLFAFCFGLFTYVGSRRTSGLNSSGVFDGLAAAAAIFARIDAVLFVLPQLLLMPGSRRRKATALGVIVALLIFYMAVNRHLFGVAMPISGDVKALGGLQLNHVFFHQLTAVSDQVTEVFYVIFSLLVISPLLIARTTDKIIRSVLLAFVVGTFTFLLRLIFLSSWDIWPWYNYPLLLAYVGCMPLALISAQRMAPKLVSYRTMLGAVSLLIMVWLGFSFQSAVKVRRAMPLGAYAINHEALERYGATLSGAYVAMGDRAGNFAAQYSGGVDQLEGIMNDKEYFEMLRKKGDVKALLCRRGVKFVVSYQPDLGVYDNHDLPTIRPELSQYPAPHFTVSHQDEVGKVWDLGKFKTYPSYLYIWRLRCE